MASSESLIEPDEVTTRDSLLTNTRVSLIAAGGPTTGPTSAQEPSNHSLSQSTSIKQKVSPSFGQPWLPDPVQELSPTACTVSIITSIDRIPAFPEDCSEFGVVLTTRGPNPINHKAILHGNCHSSPANRIFYLYPTYVTLMSTHCMLSELE